MSKLYSIVTRCLGQLILTVTPSVTSATSETLTATVPANGATGTITFYDGPTSLGAGTLISGSGSPAICTLSAGHRITRYAALASSYIG